MTRTTRAPSDVLRLGVAAFLLLLTIVLAALFQDRIVENVARTTRGLDNVSGRFLAVLASLGQVLEIVVLGGGAIVAALRRDWRLLGSAVVAAGLAAAIALVLGNIFDTDVTVARVDQSLTLVDTGHLATVAGLAAVTAVVTAAAPWVSRRWRRWAWLTVIVLAVVRLLTAPVSFGTAFALLAGWTAGAAVIVVLGAPSRRPTPESIATGMAAVGVPLDGIEPLAVDARGSTPYLADASDGRKLFVKALGEDERSADLMFRLYRSVQPRDLGDERPFSSLRRMVEHEALVALSADGLGVRTPRFVALATADPNGYVLSYEAIAGRSLDRLDDDEMTDGVLTAAWAQIAVLQAHRVAHRDLRLANLFYDETGQVWIIDFGFAELAASDLLLANDVAELLASSSTKVGARRSVDAALAGVGPAVLARALPRLQLPMLSGATRTTMKASPELWTDLRARAETAAQESAGSNQRSSSVPPPV